VTYNRYMTKKTTDKKQAEHYVNNKEFTAAVAEYNASVKLAESQGKTPPRMTEYIGECIYRLQPVYPHVLISLTIPIEMK